ncbi:MAG TPA: TIGR03118 family protein [Bryobacteraceae bacterium]
MITKFALIGLAAVSAFSTFALGDGLNSYAQTNLVSDLPNMALHQDADLVNPWGIVASPAPPAGFGSPFWINDNGKGLATIYDGTGTKQGLIVTIPPAGAAAPTGIVFNGTGGFAGSHFIFATEDGTIAAWTSGTSAALMGPGGATGSVYKGLALGNNGSGDLLYAANFGLGRVDVFNSTFASTTVSGGFTDPNLPAGYAPFNIQNLNGKLYVTYALQDAAHKDDVAGAGHGFIDVFDFNGTMLQRLVSDGNLNSPWGLAIAPSTFGAFGGDLLVGNFGNGWINAYDANTGALRGTLNDTAGNPLVIQGLWGLAFGNGFHSQGANTLFFTAGIAGPDNLEDHGLFGSLDATPEPAPAALLICAFVLAAIVRVRQRRLANKVAN